MNYKKAYTYSSDSYDSENLIDKIKVHVNWVFSSPFFRK